MTYVVINSKAPKAKYEAKVPWDASLTQWEQFIRYYGVIARALNKFRSQHASAELHEQEAAVDLAETSLLGAVTRFDPARGKFEPYAYMDLTGDLWKYWNVTVPGRRLKKRKSELNLREDTASMSFEPEHFAAFNLLISSVNALTEAERVVLFRQYVDCMSLDAIQVSEFPHKSRAWVGSISRAARNKVAKSLTT